MPGRPVAKRLARHFWIPNEEQTVLPHLQLRTKMPQLLSVQDSAKDQSESHLSSGFLGSLQWLGLGYEAILQSPTIHPSSGFGFVERGSQRGGASQALHSENPAAARPPF